MANRLNIYKKRRLLAGLENAPETANILNISLSYLYSIENGSREPGRKVLLKMAKLYKCSIDDFFLPKNYTKRGVERETMHEEEAIT